MSGTSIHSLRNGGTSLLAESHPLQMGGSYWKGRVAEGSMTRIACTQWSPVDQIQVSKACLVPRPCVRAQQIEGRHDDRTDERR